MHAAESLTAASLLQLMWLASPALPVGGFAYSEGFEMAVDSGRVDGEASAASWLQDQLGLTLTRCELPVIAQAITAWRQAKDQGQPRLRELNDWLLQTRETSELRAQSEQMGRSLLEWLRNHADTDAAQISFCASLAPTYPIAFALAASKTQAGLSDCLLSYAFGWAENMTQAAIKSIPLGQSAGQRILSRLAAAIPPAVQTAISMRDAQRQTFSPMLAILSSQHETQYSRLFRS